MGCWAAGLLGIVLFHFRFHAPTFNSNIGSRLCATAIHVVKLNEILSTFGLVEPLIPHSHSFQLTPTHSSDSPLILILIVIPTYL